MAKKKQTTKKSTTSNSPKNNPLSFLQTRQTKTVFATFLILFALFLTIAFISFFFNWQEDQSTLQHLTDKTVKSNNLLGKIGAKLSHFFIYDGFGFAAFIIAFQIFLTGIYIIFKKKISKIIISWNWHLFLTLWLSVTLGFVDEKYALAAGVIGFEVNEYLQTFIGKTGLIIALIFLIITYIIARYKVTFDALIDKIKQKIEARKLARLERENQEDTVSTIDEEPKDEEISETISLEKDKKSNFEISLENLKPTISKHSDVKKTKEDEPVLIVDEHQPKQEEKEVNIDVEVGEEEESETENLSDKILKDFGEFDPTLELSNYKFPTFNLLKQYNESISIDPEELEANKNRIVETLKNYKIGIDEIKATVGPTITLYEIVPEAGIRISKIKNLEDDIALSLSALGIRIVAPIPGKGTIGIEVPNKKSTVVSMHSAISSKKFQESQMELPIAIGKTISNETFVVDLAKICWIKCSVNITFIQETSC